MKDKITTFERRVELLFFITYRKKTTVPELVNMFSVCESTVYNDIIFLSRYAPIYTKMGFATEYFFLVITVTTYFSIFQRTRKIYLQSLKKALMVQIKVVCKV